MVEGARRVIVTGASSGLGLAIANYLHGQGYKVFRTTRKGVSGANPHGAFDLIQMDVTDEASVEAAIVGVVERAGGLDAIVSNAGMGIAGSLEETTIEEARLQFDTNFFGNHRVVRTALPHLRGSDASHIVVVGSIAGLIGVPFQGMYSATKFALEGYCEALRLELRNTSIRVSILEPGDFATGFTSSRLKVAAAGPQSPYHEAFEQAMTVIEREERGGADPILAGQAVFKLLESQSPPVRLAVTGEAQAGLERVKADFTPDQLEQMLADWFSGRSAVPSQSK